MSLTRRDLLTSGTALSLVGLAGCQPPPAAPSSAWKLDLPGADELIPANMPTSFSQQEMERRWTKIREFMKKAKFDCLIVPRRPEGDADVKYLIESSANWVVFPLEGQVTAIYRREQESNPARGQADLSIDNRISLLNRSQLIIDRLKELGLERGRIGVGNLSGTVRNDEGGVSYTTLSRIVEALPRARFESAVDLLMRVKLARGAEEIEVLKLVSRASELAVRRLFQHCAPGVVHRDVWFEVFKDLLDATGEVPGRISLRAGEEGNTAAGRPLNERLEAGQIMSQELSATLLGYLSQVNHSICIGTPPPSDFESAFKYCAELFYKLLDWAKPGKSFVEYSEFYRQQVEARGDAYWGVVFHTGGPLGDGPRMGYLRPDENQDLVIEPGMVFTIKPRIPIKGVSAPAAQVGDPVLITETGAERLGRRKLDVLIAGA